MAGDFLFRDPCPTCRGRRSVGDIPCKACTGTGTVDRPPEPMR